MAVIKQNESTAANRWVIFQCFDDDSADAYAPQTGITFSDGELKVAKAGGAWANAANYATVVEVGGGWYWYQFSQGECNTLGPLVLILNRTDTYADAVEVQVVAYDPNAATNLGLSYVDAATTSRLASADYENIDTWLDSASSVETGVTLRDAFRLMMAVLVGKVSGGGTSTLYFRNAVADSKVRVTAVVDASSNRTSVTVDPD